MGPRQVLVVDDDADTRKLVADVLESEGYTVLTCSNGEEALNELLNHRSVELIIADIKMPRATGTELLLQIREMGFDVQVILMTAFASVTTAVQAVRGQAFDYLTKPFSLDELRERVREALNASTQDEINRNIKRYRDLAFDETARRVWVSEREIQLTRLEFNLLAHLFEWQGCAVSTDQMLEMVWKCSVSQERSLTTVKSCVSRLRAKLGDDPADPTYIYNVWGVGYQFGE